MKLRNASLYGLISLCGLMIVSIGSAANPNRIFVGHSFEGWQGPLESFRIKDGALVGGNLKNRIPQNQFLSTVKSYSDFELSLKFKLVGENVNAGVQIRSERIPDHHEMIGYQADLGQRYWGSLYDESRRRKVLAQADLKELAEVLKPDDWNDYRIRCRGKRIQLWINGLRTVDYTEQDDSIPQTGRIAIQIHSGPPSEAWYKDIFLEELEPIQSSLKPGVRGLATRAPAGMKIDGDLSEFKNAFCTPVEYFNPNLPERAAQFFYMWDEDAFYAGLRTLDSKQANMAPDNRLWEGDGVEWYFDTRRGDDFRNREWGKGAVHCYWTGLDKKEIKPRFCLRPGYLEAITKIGVEVGVRSTEVGMEVEFKLPWRNFPEFKAQLNEVIAVDAELCYSDGGPRVDRSFAYGSPLSVQQPANLARIQLVETVRNDYWQACGPVMTPIRCDTPWSQETHPMVQAFMSIPPNQTEILGRVMFRLIDAQGSVIGEHPGKMETFEAYGNFQRARAQWPADLSDPGAYSVVGLVYDRQGNELCRVLPRMVSVGMKSGY